MTRILAHRGFHHDQPENTLAALEAAHALGCDGAEFDLRALSDGTPVLCHDASWRDGRRRRNVTATPLSAWRGSTWAEVAAWSASAPDFFLNVEVKVAGLGPALAAVLDARQPETFAVTSFDLAEATRIKREHPGWPVGWVLDKDTAGALSQARTARIDVLALSPRALKRVDLCEATKRFVVWAWGVDDLEEAARWVQEGVSAFITDDPRTLLSGLNRLREGTSRGR